MLTGAGLGLALALAEVCTDALAGRRPPLLWLAFLALYYVPALASLAAALSLLRASFPGLGADTATLFAVLAFGYAAATGNQALLKGLPFGAGLRLANLAAAGLLALVARRLLVNGSNKLRGWPCWLALVTGLVLGSELALVLLRGLPLGAQAVLMPALAFASVAAPGFALARLASPKRLEAVVRVVLGLLYAVAIGRGLSPDPVFSVKNLAARAAPAREDARPNVVLIVLDTVRAANLSCYGYARRTTPRLESFAAESVLYTDFTASASFTLPGHASLFTGLLPSRHLAGGVDPRGGSPFAPLAARVDTLAEILEGHGYATAGVVANYWFAGLVSNLDQGFQHYEAVPDAGSPSRRSLPLLRRLQGRLPDWLVRDPLLAWFGTPYRRAGEITARAARWLAQRPSGRPYFLFVNYLDAHAPYGPPAAFRRLWPGPPTSHERRPDGLSAAAAGEVMARRRPIKPDEAEHLRSLYDASLSYLDSQVGELLRRLREEPDYDRTWVVVTSDHGESLGEHGTLGHGCALYQEVLKIPLIIRYPRGVGAAASDARPVDQTDLLPTILDGLGLPVPAGLDGRPIGQTRRTRIAEAYCEAQLLGPELAHLSGERKAVRLGRYKYIEAAHGPAELFDLDADPRETTNLATREPEVALRLSGELQRWREALPPRPPGPAATPPAAWTDELRALGYVR